jgi:hypothetical protein
LATNLNKNKLIKALTIEATITEKTARSWVAGSENARFAINIATVKPIPAALPVASKSMFFAPCG